MYRCRCRWDGGRAREQVNTAAESRGALTGVDRTALSVAAMRARESRRPDRLFDDPYAQGFLDAAPGMRLPAANGPRPPGATSVPRY
ncbi:MAG: class I SAM-dependent methyltransferase [Sciscionella sp.]